QLLLYPFSSASRISYIPAYPLIFRPTTPFTFRPCLSLSPPRYIRLNPSRLLASDCSSLICALPTATDGIPAVHHDNASISPSTTTTLSYSFALSNPYTIVLTGVALLS